MALSTDIALMQHYKMPLSRSHTDKPINPRVQHVLRLAEGANPKLDKNFARFGTNILVTDYKACFQAAQVRAWIRLKRFNPLTFTVQNLDNGFKKLNPLPQYDAAQQTPQFAPASRKTGNLHPISDCL